MIPGLNENDNPWLYIALVQWPIAVAPAMFTWLVPKLLRYRRGEMARIAMGMSLLLTALLAVNGFSPSLRRHYPYVHHALFVVFFVYAAAGLSLCGVGLYDRKRSAVWATLAVLAMTIGGAIDAVHWMGAGVMFPRVPAGFIACCMLFTIGYIRRRADPPAMLDLRQSAQIAANNLTRRSRSITRKLLREGRLHLLPVFFVLCLSDLCREGIANSGSHEFADHIYRSVPSGRTWLGRKIDAMVLSLPATRAFRERYKRAQQEIRTALEEFPDDGQPLRVLAIPCGLPRDMTELAAALTQENPALLARVQYMGMDVDPVLLEKATRFVDGSPLLNVRFHRGNALLAEDYPAGKFHAIVSTGLGEFLDDEQLATFYRNVFHALCDGGTFYTSATRAEASSDLLLRMFELETNYRAPADLERILRSLPWRRLVIAQDDSGLQSFVTAVK